VFENAYLPARSTTYDCRHASSGVLPLLGVLPLPTSVKPEELPVVVLGGHEGAVLTTQHDDVGIRLVEVVVELGG
jgi:hypothetical protein